MDAQVGTKNYAAPEVAAGRPYNGMKADVFSLAVVFIEVLSGHDFSSLADFTLDAVFVYKQIECLLRRHNCGDVWIGLVLRMINFDPNMRCSSTDVMRAIEKMSCNCHEILIEEEQPMANLSSQAVSDAIDTSSWSSGSSASECDPRSAWHIAAPVAFVPSLQVPPRPLPPPPTPPPDVPLRATSSEISAALQQTHRQVNECVHALEKLGFNDEANDRVICQWLSLLGVSASGLDDLRTGVLAYAVLERLCAPMPPLPAPQRRCAHLLNCVTNWATVLDTLRLFNVKGDRNLWAPDLAMGNRKQLVTVAWLLMILHDKLLQE
eukprot:TRINITY_DN4738_c0_g1_i3.p1 TRINITY_DN4738_c0_g1~~TRINITY_DN4738_c0_g1_i3.p1  ORF type:complete len:322 (-),score=83.15 TRINITY_DN4738_c0_g1_i3:77-1042(-)